MREKGFLGLIVLMVLVFAFTLVIPLEADAKKGNGKGPSENGQANGIRHIVTRLEGEVTNLQNDVGDLKDQVNVLYTPIAIATVADVDGVLSVKGTDSVLDVSWETVRYEVTIDGEYYLWEDYTTNVTLIEEFSGLSVVTGSDGGVLTVYIYDADGVPVRNSFQFVVYK